MKATDGLQLGFEALDASARPVSRQVVIERLTPLARELAKVRGAGITVGELRHEAQKRGLLPRESKGREFSFDCGTSETPLRGDVCRLVGADASARGEDRLEPDMGTRHQQAGNLER